MSDRLPSSTFKMVILSPKLFPSFAEKFPSSTPAGLPRTAAAATPGSDPAGGHGGGGGGNEGDTFVVQRGRTVPTLSSVSSTTDKEHLNQVCMFV